MTHPLALPLTPVHHDGQEIGGILRTRSGAWEGFVLTPNRAFRPLPGWPAHATPWDARTAVIAHHQETR